MNIWEIPAANRSHYIARLKEVANGSQDPDTKTACILVPVKDASVSSPNRLPMGNPGSLGAPRQVHLDHAR